MIITFEQKRREKQLVNERILLRELPMEELQKSVIRHIYDIDSAKKFILWKEEGIEDNCFDIAIESYLVGGEYSRFYLHGESIEQTKLRSGEERELLIDTLYNCWLYWDKALKKTEKAFRACEQFVDEWWEKGYRTGERRYKLRLR